MGILLVAEPCGVDNPQVYGEIDYKINTFMVSINDQ